MKLLRFLRKRPPTALELLSGSNWLCSRCDAPHQGMIDFAAFRPDPWRGPEVYAPNNELILDRDFLSEDFCVMDGKYFFVRCVLEIPVHGLAQKFGFGCWGTLSRTNFERYVDRFDDAGFQGEGPWGSWLCNQLLDYVGDEPLACWMHPQLDRQRPVLRVQDADHPLAIAQADGVDAEVILEIYRRSGHEVRI